jgi:hypothetical protein
MATTNGTIASCVALVFLAACRWSSVPVYSIGPYDTEPPELFRGVELAVRTQGYQPVSVDPSRGTIVLASNTRLGGSSMTFTVQCYRGGWIRIVPSGAHVLPDGDSTKMKNRLEREYETLVLGLSDSLAPTRGGGE